MNKAFVREPDSDDKAYCPRCRGLGTPVAAPAIDTHVRPDRRAQISRDAWYCGSLRCDVVYFNEFEQVIELGDLKAPVYPYDPDAPMCACFGFTEDDLDADVDEGHPTRIRELLQKSKSPEARCQSLAVDGQCCLREVQKLYMKRRG